MLLVVLPPFFNVIRIHDFEDVRPHVVVGRDHLYHNIFEVLVLQEAVVILTLRQEFVNIFKQAFLQFDRLIDMLLVNYAVLTMTKMRCRHEKFIFYRPALEFDRQLQLGGAPGRNLQQNDAEGEDVGGGRFLQELDVDLALVLR